MLPFSLQGLATRWLACLPGRGSHPLDYTTLPGRTINLSPFVLLFCGRWRDRPLTFCRGFGV